MSTKTFFFQKEEKKNAQTCLVIKPFDTQIHSSIDRLPKATSTKHRKFNNCLTRTK